MHRITVPLLLLAALTFFAGLGRGAITDSDEAFYAESAREMVASGDWLTPYYNYEPRWQKPVKASISDVAGVIGYQAPTVAPA